MKGSTKDIIQWHPAFHASIQIEFKDEDGTAGSARNSLHSR